MKRSRQEALDQIIIDRDFDKLDNLEQIFLESEESRVRISKFLLDSFLLSKSSTAECQKCLKSLVSTCKIDIKMKIFQSKTGILLRKTIKLIEKTRDSLEFLAILRNLDRKVFKDNLNKQELDLIASKLTKKIDSNPNLNDQAEIQRLELLIDCVYWCAECFSSFNLPNQRLIISLTKTLMKSSNSDLVKLVSRLFLLLSKSFDCLTYKVDVFELAVEAMQVEFEYLFGVLKEFKLVKDFLLALFEIATKSVNLKEPVKDKQLLVERICSLLSSAIKFQYKLENTEISRILTGILPNAIQILNYYYTPLLKNESSIICMYYIHNLALVEKFNCESALKLLIANMSFRVIPSQLECPFQLYNDFIASFYKIFCRNFQDRTNLLIKIFNFLHLIMFDDEKTRDAFLDLGLTTVLMSDYEFDKDTSQWYIYCVFSATRASNFRQKFLESGLIKMVCQFLGNNDHNTECIVKLLKILSENYGFNKRFWIEIHQDFFKFCSANLENEFLMNSIVLCLNLSLQYPLIQKYFITLELVERLVLLCKLNHTIPQIVSRLFYSTEIVQEMIKYKCYSRIIGAIFSYTSTIQEFSDDLESILNFETRDHQQVVDLITEIYSFAKSNKSPFSLWAGVALSCHKLDFELVQVLFNSITDHLDDNILVAIQFATLKSFSNHITNTKGNAKVIDTLLGEFNGSKTDFFTDLVSDEPIFTLLKSTADLKFRHGREQLACLSPVLRALLQGGFRESKQQLIELDGISVDTWRLFLTYSVKRREAQMLNLEIKESTEIATTVKISKLDNSMCMILQLYEFSQKYLIDTLKNDCESWIFQQLSKDPLNNSSLIDDSISFLEWTLVKPQLVENMDDFIGISIQNLLLNLKSSFHKLHFLIREYNILDTFQEFLCSNASASDFLAEPLSIGLG